VFALLGSPARLVRNEIDSVYFVSPFVDTNMRLSDIPVGAK